MFSREKLGHIVITGYNGKIEKQPLDLAKRKFLVTVITGIEKMLEEMFSR